MLDTNEIKKGMNIRVDGQLYRVLDHQHHKPGKGGAVMRTKIKNLTNGAITEKTFRGGDRVEEVTLETKKYQYLYNRGGSYCFMDVETYEQILYPEEKLGSAAKFLKDNTEVNVLLHNSDVIGVDLPKNVTLKVIYTEPGHRGNTATNVTKPATVETGIEVQVPLFINKGDSIVVDIESGEYVERL